MMHLLDVPQSALGLIPSVAQNAAKACDYGSGRTANVDVMFCDCQALEQHLLGMLGDRRQAMPLLASCCQGRCPAKLSSSRRGCWRRRGLRAPPSARCSTRASSACTCLSTGCCIFACCFNGCDHHRSLWVSAPLRAKLRAGASGGEAADGALLGVGACACVLSEYRAGRARVWPICQHAATGTDARPPAEEPVSIRHVCLAAVVEQSGMYPHRIWLERGPKQRRAAPMQRSRDSSRRP